MSFSFVRENSRNGDHRRLDRKRVRESEVRSSKEDRGTNSRVKLISSRSPTTPRFHRSMEKKKKKKKNDSSVLLWKINPYTQRGEGKSSNREARDE